MYNIYDKKELRKIYQSLEKLGLNEKETSVYLDLLSRNQETGSTKIVLSTKLHRQYVYTALDSLESKGLIKHVIKNGRKKFSANPPYRINSLVEEKKIIANEVVDSLDAMFSKHAEQEFEVYQGREQFIAHEFQMLEEAEENDFIDIIAGKGDQFASMLGEEREEYNKLSLSKNLQVRFIGSQDQLEYLTKIKGVRQNFNFRVMPKFHKSNVSTSIRKNNITFQIYGNPLLAFKIKSEEIASNYKVFFDALWEMCEK